jgi:hypothetical protein
MALRMAEQMPRSTHGRDDAVNLQGEAGERQWATKLRCPRTELSSRRLFHTAPVSQMPQTCTGRASASAAGTAAARRRSAGTHAGADETDDGGAVGEVEERRHGGWSVVVGKGEAQRPHGCQQWRQQPAART